MNTLEFQPRQLILDNLAVNFGLARRLPPNLAFHYHALPVAKDNGHITVAMANPNDQAAREVISTALGAKLYAVQGNSAAIDKLLAQVWPGQAQQPLRMLVYHQANPITTQMDTYARYLSKLLDSQLSYYQTESGPNNGLDDLVEKASCGHDLVIFEEPDQSLIRRILLGPAGCKAAERVPTSVLVARSPRSPLQKILFVTRGQSGVDNVAVDWIVRLAQPSKATVTVLALVPAIPPMYQRAMVSMPHGLADWLTIDTPLGWQLRQIARQLVNWEITGTLRFRQGSPDQQIQQEVSAENYDLVIIAADPQDWWLRRMLGKLIDPILHWADLPVLIAKPTIT